MKERYANDHLHILAPKRNAGSCTYDGIELGGERVAYEIEEALDALAADGCSIRKLSVVGYSLGGLVGRYALGLLEARGWLDKLEPVNFTTFASPHVGVRTPLAGILSAVWNILGARTVSMSGRQLFMIDSFRDTGKPLLSVLADPDTIFIRALARFKHRCLYSNIVNDRTAVFYTTCISDTDPFNDVDLDHADLNYIKGYEPVVIDPNMYFLPPRAPRPSSSSTHSSTIEASSPASSSPDAAAAAAAAKRTTNLASSAEMRARLAKILTKVPLFMLMPIGILLFLMNSVIQDVRSRRRIRLHGEGGMGALFGTYKVPLIIQDVRDAVEDAIETANTNPVEDLVLSDDDDDDDDDGKGSEGKKKGSSPSLLHLPPPPTAPSHAFPPPSSSGHHEAAADDNGERLALTPAQFAIIDSLNSLGFRKYPVFIHNTGHSHAAMIVRIPGWKYEEGKIVVKHWLDHEFEV